MESCNEKNGENFTVDGKSKSRTPPVRDGSSHAKEEFESRPNNLVSKSADVLFKSWLIIHNSLQIIRDLWLIVHIRKEYNDF